MTRLLLFLSLFAPASIVWGGGVRVGNGGNIVRCVGETSFKSVEYVLTKDLYGKNIFPTPIKSLNDSFNRIAGLMAKKAPQFANSFRTFVNEYRNTDESKTYIWKPGYIDTLKEETIYLPFWCQNSQGATEIVQAIIRTRHKDSRGKTVVYFDYDPRDLDSLEGTSALQLSFLIVHEWIWNLTNDPQKNRRLDYFLHSSYFDSMAPGQVSAELRRLGF